jgi:hypothetical protein
VHARFVYDPTGYVVLVSHASLQRKYRANRLTFLLVPVTPGPFVLKDRRFTLNAAGIVDIGRRFAAP